MLAKIYRLTKNSDFEVVKNNGKRTDSSIFAILYIKRDDDKETRFGFVISTKISKHASKRNRVKRALTEAVRQNLYYLKKGYDIVFLAKPQIENAYTADIMNETKKIFKKAGLTK